MQPKLPVEAAHRKLPPRTEPPDMVLMKILDSTMVSICREMGILLMKTSYSTIFNEGLDFTCALADDKGDMIACAEFCPTMIGGMPLLIKTCAQEIPFDTIEEGDVILHNDPYRGGLHCPEHTFFKPFFVDGELKGFAVCIGHIAEIGGMVPGAFCGEATEIFHEGLRVPPVKIKKAGKDVDEVWKLLLANCRTPRQNYGDLRAMIGCVDLGVARITEIIKKYGSEVFTRTCEDLMDYAERRMRAELASFPDGKYGFEDVIENDGIEAQALHRRDRHVRPGRRGGGRLFAQLASGQRADQRHARGRDRRGLQRPAARHRPVDPQELGRFRPIRVVAPPGRVTNVDYPGPLVAGNTETHPRLANITIGAMGQCVPERAMASESCTGTNFVFGGNHPDHDEYFACYDLMSGGWGGRFGHDGNDCVIAINGNCRFNPTEVFETRFPLLVEDCATDHRFRRRRAVARRPRLHPHAQGHQRADHRQPVQRPPRGQAVRAVRRPGGRQRRDPDPEGRQRRMADRARALRQGQLEQIRQRPVPAGRPHQALDAGRRRLRRSARARSCRDRGGPARGLRLGRERGSRLWSSCARST